MWMIYLIKFGLMTLCGKASPRHLKPELNASRRGCCVVSSVVSLHLFEQQEARQQATTTSSTFCQLLPYYANFVSAVSVVKLRDWIDLIIMFSRKKCILACIVLLAVAVGQSLALLNVSETHDSKSVKALAPCSYVTVILRDTYGRYGDVVEHVGKVCMCMCM